MPSDTGGTADAPRLPEGLVVTRTTPEFDTVSTPAGLRAAHQVAEGVWGRLRVLAGTVRFVFEEPEPVAYDLGPGDEMAIPPRRHHHVEPGADARFVVEFLRPAQ